MRKPVRPQGIGGGVNPFINPDEARRQSAEHIAKLARERINPLIAAGARALVIDVGIYEDVAAGLGVSWHVSVRDVNEKTATLVIKKPAEGIPVGVQVDAITCKACGGCGYERADVTSDPAVEAEN